jgi:hypothetical protein
MGEKAMIVSGIKRAGIAVGFFNGVGNMIFNIV